ncbi:MAG TPA: NTP transferase domain-containing protein [Candidatus Wallbacteria bacterium]|nr:MAG: Bifunctional IPC transferase and DIPP synthase [bacterium ADurb.Bin243]HOD39588.1 NTP transferase domain-containing protein [Candidatus Wallbacteria bacterium]HPG56824.1 NTP transferase domain-containing protein [Candidatus Wallbacteria bacterium]
MIKKAVILAAGVGSRMGDLTVDTPKCLIDLGGTNSLDYILKCLQECEIDETLIIVGHLREKIRSFIRTRNYKTAVKLVENDFYNYHGCEYSMALSAPHLKNADSAVIVEADLLMPAQYFARVIGSPHENCVLLRNCELNPARSVAACGRGGSVRHFAYDENHIDVFKYIEPGEDVIGESMQMWKFGGAALKHLIEMFEDYLYNIIGEKPDTRNGLFSINRAAAKFPLSPVIIESAEWINLNTLEDVAKGRNASWIKKYL